MENDFYVVDNIVASKYLIFPTIESARHYMMKEYMLHFKDWFGPDWFDPDYPEEIYETVVSDFENLNKELPFIEDVMYCYPAEVYESEI